MLFYQPTMAAVVILSTGFGLIVSRAAVFFIRRAAQEQTKTGASEQTYLLDTIRSVSLIKVMGAERRRRAQWQAAHDRSHALYRKTGNIQSLASAVHAAVASLATVAVIYLGAREIMSGGQFTLGMLLAFLSFRAIFSERVVAAAAQLGQLGNLDLHWGRLKDLLETMSEPVAEAPDPSIEVHGGLELQEIRFRYGLSSPYILDGASLEIKVGEFVAVTGATGEGKTTLVKLLLGLYSPERGQVVLDGSLPQDHDWRAWRARVGYVAQSDMPVSGTIASNIALFDPEPSMERVRDAARAVLLDDEVMALPMGYRSELTELGANLSAGQRQKLLLARALYRKPAILIIDDGISSLDPKIEGALVTSLRRLNLTRVVVSHSAAVISVADRVVRLADGKLRECARTASDGLG